MDDLLSFIFSFILDLFDDIAEWTIPSSIKAWYRRRKKITRSILKGILDGVLYIIALVCFDTDDLKWYKESKENEYQ